MKLMTSRAFIFLVLASIYSLTAQNKLKGNKIVVTENRDISEFSKIEIRSNIDVILTQGNNQSVVVETDENLQFAVLTEVKDNTLVIQLFKKIIKKKVLNVYITIDEFLDVITTKDKATIIADRAFNFDSIIVNAEDDSKIIMDIKSDIFTLNTYESAHVKMNVNTDSIFINANKTGKTNINLNAEKAKLLMKGNSTAELSGNCKELIVVSENKSNVRTSKLECHDAIVTASDASDTYINSKISLTVSAINSAEIYIYGNPEITIGKFADKAILRKK